MLIVCFEDRLATEWYRIYQAMETIVDSQICKATLYFNTFSLNFLLIQNYQAFLLRALVHPFPEKLDPRICFPSTHWSHQRITYDNSEGVNSTECDTDFNIPLFNK